METVHKCTLSPLAVARRKLYEIAGGSIDSGDVRASRLTTAQRIEYFKSREFADWVAAEKAAGRHIFWLKDVDKTQAAGDIFTFFFKWRADNGKFTGEQLKVIEDFLRSKNRGRLARAKRGDAAPHEVLRLWLEKEEGRRGLGLLDFWSGAYWPSQIGLTQAEKLEQVRLFVPHYAPRVFPHVREENLLLESLGVHVVIVSNGDQELAIAASNVLGIKPENTVGSHLRYKDGLAEGVNHSYEIFDEDWEARPQPGKSLSFHYWLHVNRARFGWDTILEDEYVIGGRDGDSATTDGGMMCFMPHQAAIGNFMIDVPDEPKRIEKFYSIAAKYGWTRGQFITLVQARPQLGFRP